MLAYLCHHEDRRDYFISMIPYGLTSMAAYLQKQGFQVILANFSQDGHRKAAAMVLRERPDLLGVSIFAFNRVESLRLIKSVAREAPGIVIAAGGPFAASMADELARRYPEINHIIRGESEEALASLARDIGKGRQPGRVIDGVRLKDLDDLPFSSDFTGAAYGMNPYDQYQFLITSRGCPGACTFCSSPSFWGRRVSFRSPEHILGEIRSLYEKRGIIYFSIRDDNFTMSKKRVMAFSTMLREKGPPIMWNCQARVDTVDLEMLVAMKRAGLEHIQYGIESGSRRVLGRYNKRISIDRIVKAAGDTRKAGILLSVYLMTGMLGEREEDVLRTVRLIRRIRPNDGIVSPVAYYPGTGLYNAMKDRGLITDDAWFDRGDSGIYVRGDGEVKRWIDVLAGELMSTGERFRYAEKDFVLHRKIAGNDCWVTDILAGDYYSSVGDAARSKKAYEAVAGINPWGHLRLGGIAAAEGAFGTAEKVFTRVTELAPSYFGAWLELAGIYLKRKNHALAKRMIERAHQFNRHDPRVRKLYQKIQALR